jgi:hypothetical protein
MLVQVFELQASLGIQSTTQKTYWKLPLGLPQRLDPVVMRHSCLERLCAHDPVLARTPAILTRSFATHDARSELMQMAPKRCEKMSDTKQARKPALNHADDLLLGEKGHSVLGTHTNSRDGASPAAMRGRGGSGNN